MICDNRVEITPMKIDEDNWTTKFQSLVVKGGQRPANGIGYEYKDAEGNILKFSDLKGGNTYQRARSCKGQGRTMRLRTESN